MFSQLRIHYPKGSLVTELVAIDHGQYIVRCLVQNEGIILVTGLAAAQTVEVAEDQARSRALTALGLFTTTVTPQPQAPPIISPASLPLTPNPVISSPTLSDSFAVPAAMRSQGEETSQLTPKPETTTVREANPLFSVESKIEEVVAPMTTPLVADERSFTNQFDSTEVADGLSFTNQFDSTEVADGLSFTNQFDSTEVETGIEMTAKVSPLPQQDTPMTAYTPNHEVEPDTSGVASTTSPIDFSDIIARTNVELKRLGWTNSQGRDYLVQTYGKRSRQLLKDDELLDFLQHLESVPSP